MSVTKMERATAMLIYWISSFSSHKMNGYNGGGVVELEKKQQESFECKGYIEQVLVILHEKELTWVGRLSYKHHTCVISALSISTTLKQHQLIWSPTVYLFSYSDLGFLYG
ncbi:hypothetical protein HanHA300_Chr03g0091051 [Helianthus annuus]|nr:hypothetical protein HanHA300_Chr03g0091051 [Helianthus annuus]KAJ0773741.1 hypothetical protein HanOQP8_Chr03g0103761 [Helianthus annuus]